MGAEHSQQQRSIDSNGRNGLETDSQGNSVCGTTRSRTSLPSANINSKRQISRQTTGSFSKQSQNSVQDTDSPTSSDNARPASPPLSVCYDSDLPYVSYTDRPIGDSPKIRNKNQVALYANGRNSSRKMYTGAGVKPKRPQSTSNHNIVIVKPGAKDSEVDIDPDLSRLRSMPMFLPVIRETVALPSSTREPEILERLQSTHLQSMCSRMQAHYNFCATHVAAEQNEIIDKTKAVNNTITILFATYVDMQKTYAAYAEQFSKIRQISQQLSRCNSLLNDNIESLETINNFLNVNDRLEPFIWRTDDTAALGPPIKVELKPTRRRT